MRKPVVPTRDEAETLALQAVTLIAQRPELFRRFLDLAGVDVDALKARLQDPSLLGAVLDFVLFDDTLTLELAEAAGVPPDRPAAARRVLPGAS